ncbi:unnamed protein product [Orchesella dallaii]|uniref:Uncharacterized protein n=1 Tax=Orchesella dallaii TaxID=48710 RepID=A0ABP1QBV0_9HEXA
MAFQRLVKFRGRKLFVLRLILIWIFQVLPFFVAGNVTTNPVRAELTMRNYSSSHSMQNTSVILPSRNQSLALNVIKNRLLVSHENRTSDEESVSGREAKSLPTPSKFIGVDEDGTHNPEDLIRKALINHTLEHGGEEDLDKLVFSTLPEGSKLILRTVKIIRTDENGEPMDDAEDTQPTYWDVTLANATDTVLDNEEEAPEDEEEESEEGSEEEEDEKQPKDIIAHKKKSDLESSGSHSSANYHHLTNHGGSGREKEIGKAHYHGNTHGKTHKQTHTDTKGKNVKPYHGTEKGLTDYANDAEKSNKNEGERFKSSKRKNKGRKVSGFKRIYHKEEFQRTEHFFDDEEANRIAESFGLSEAKEGNNQGTKGDKRKYHGVRTEHLDGKKLKNEYGTRDGYDKGQHTSYKDHEKHNLHSNYGKSMSQSHGSAPHQHESYHPHNGHAQNTDYHPNHNYHGSYSSPRHNAVLKVPTSVADHIGNGKHSDAYRGTIVSAPMATSFTVTEYTTMAEPSSTPDDPSLVSVLAKTLNRFPMPRFTHGNFSDTIHNFNRTMHGVGRKQPQRKEPREKKMFFSPKYRPIKEDDIPPITTIRIPVKTFKPVPLDAVPYQVTPAVNRGKEEETEEEDDEEDESEEQSTPYAPNFRPRKRPQRPRPMSQPPPPQGYRQGSRKLPESWRFPRRNKRPRPHPPPQSAPMVQDESEEYPQHVNLSNEPLAISLRHSSSFNRLGKRARQQELPHMDQISYHEISTRKSDISFDNDMRNDTDDDTNDSAHYFNHNQRYAKNHLTSTISPSGNNDGVRNTLMDSPPGVYSTIIKVLPATMLNVSETHGQRENEHGRRPNNALTASGNIVSVTRRPKSHSDMVSITTAFPQHHPQQHRPFIPNNRWLTLSLNLGGHDHKLGSEFGPAPHPFPRQNKKMSHIMRGIRNGLLKPFGRAPFFPHHALVAAPSITGPAFHMHGKGPVMNNMPPPHMLHRPRPYHIRHLHRHQQLRPHSFPTNHGGYNRPMVGIASQTSVQQIHSAHPPLSPNNHNNNKRPKFYYNYKPNGASNNGTDSNSNSKQQESRNVETSMEQTAPSSPSSTQSTKTVTVTSSSSTSPPIPDQTGRKLPPTPPFMNGLMDSVSGFFGKMG